jgi:hypothetical protein
MDTRAADAATVDRLVRRVGDELTSRQASEVEVGRARIAADDERQLAQALIGRELEVLATEALREGRDPLDAGTERRLAVQVLDRLYGLGPLQELLSLRGSPTSRSPVRIRCGWSTPTAARKFTHRSWPARASWSTSSPTPPAVSTAPRSASTPRTGSWTCSSPTATGSTPSSTRPRRGRGSRSAATTSTSTGWHISWRPGRSTGRSSRSSPPRHWPG